MQNSASDSDLPFEKKVENAGKFAFQHPSTHVESASWLSLELEENVAAINYLSLFSFPLSLLLFSFIFNWKLKTEVFLGLQMLIYIYYRHHHLTKNIRKIINYIYIQQTTKKKRN